CSVGWAPFPWFVQDAAALNYEEVLKLADRALYMAKESGRNCAVGAVPASASPLYCETEQEELPYQTGRGGHIPAKVSRTAGPVLECRQQEASFGEHLPSTGTRANIEAGETNTNSSTLLQYSDSAMHGDIRDGRNRAIYHPLHQGVSMREWMSLENQLRGAIARGEISLQYQPEFDFSKNQLSRFEALARWNHPTLGTISPAKFIPIAEESGIIVILGTYIMEQACREAVRWQKLASRPVQVAVNVSSFQFVRDTFVEEVLEILERTGLKPELLQIEVTESAMICGLTRSVETIQRLHAHGISLAIDDFGTGYSCLSYLPHLGFDVL